MFKRPKGLIPVVDGPRLTRADVRLVSGFIRAGDLIPDCYHIPHLDPRTGKGYQRLPQNARVNELAVDLRKGRVDLPTAILLNLRSRSAESAVSGGILDLNSLRAVSKEPAESKFFVVDGQHRVLALQRLIEEFDEARWVEYQIPFICMLGATEKEEMEQFYLVNSKAKSVRTDLAYELLYQRAEDPDVMESLVERGKDWQVTATGIVKLLSVDSPIWRGRIRFPAMEKGDTIMPSASIVSSLKPVLQSPYFKALSTPQQVQIIDSFWRGIRNVYPEAFDEPAEFSLQKGIGVTVLHTVMMQVVEIARSKGMSLVEPETYEDVLKYALENLQGDDARGVPVSGLDFWRSAPYGAAGSYSSSAGRRVLVAKIQTSLPKMAMQ
jgi:DGQHR domain-containing protein